MKFIWKLYEVQISLLIKLYGNTPTVTRLCVIYGYFHAAVAELSSCDNRDCSVKYLLFGSLRKRFAIFWSRVFYGTIPSLFGTVWGKWLVIIQSEDHLKKKKHIGLKFLTSHHQGENKNAFLLVSPPHLHQLSLHPSEEKIEGHIATSVALLQQSRVHLECLRVWVPSTCSKQLHHPAHAPIGSSLYLPSHYSTSLANLCNNSRETGVDYVVTQAGSFDRKSLSFTLKKLLENISLSKVLLSQGY